MIEDDFIEFVDTEKLREERLKQLQEEWLEKDIKGPGVFFGHSLKNPKRTGMINELWMKVMKNDRITLSHVQQINSMQ